MTIGAIYRPPSADFSKSLEELAYILQQLPKKCTHIRCRLQRTSGNGEGVVLKFRTFPDGGGGGGGGGCESSDVRKFLKKSKFQKLKLEIIIYRDSNMRSFTYDVCSNLCVGK